VYLIACLISASSSSGYAFNVSLFCGHTASYLLEDYGGCYSHSSDDWPGQISGSTVIWSNSFIYNIHRIEI